MSENIHDNRPASKKDKKVALPPSTNGAALEAGRGIGNDRNDNVVAMPTPSLKEVLAGSTTSAPSNVGARPTLTELRAAMGVQPSLGTIDRVAEQYECRDPKKEAEYFQSHPDLTLWQEAIMLIDLDGFDKASFLVALGMQPVLRKWLRRRLLVPCVNQDGEFFIWGITIADIMLGQRTTKVEQNNREIAQKARAGWITRVWFKGKHIGEPAAEGGVHLGEPEWPKDLTADLIIERTFLGNYISDREHEMAKIYLGTAKR